MSQTHQRFPWRVTGLVALIVVAASLVAGLLLGQNRVGSGQSRPPQATPSPSPSASRPSPLLDADQVTALLTVRDADRNAVSNVLLGVDPQTAHVVELMLPRDLLLPTTPPMRLAQVSDPTGTATADEPLETLLGVQIDALIDLDRLAWTGLIDATGSRVDLRAAASPGAFGLVLDPVLRGVPYEPQTVGELLTGLGSMARTSVTNEDASAILSLVGRGTRKRSVTRALLPVTYLRAAPARVAVIDRGAADPLLREMFGPSLLEPGHPGPLRVVVQQAGATVGATTWARTSLADAGMGVLLEAPSDADVPRTRILLPDGSAEAARAGDEVAVALGLPDADIAVDHEQPTVDVRVLLGPDAPLPPRS